MNQCITCNNELHHLELDSGEINIFNNSCLRCFINYSMKSLEVARDDCIKRIDEHTRAAHTILNQAKLFLQEKDKT